MPIVHFYLRFQSKHGQKFFVSGTAPELGKELGNQAVAMQYLNHETWYLKANLDSRNTLSYKYILREDNGLEQMEWPADKFLTAEQMEEEEIVVVDTWCYPGAAENVFVSQPFKEVLLRREVSHSLSKSKTDTHTFRVKAPLLAQNETLYLMGNQEMLGNWNTDSGIRLEPLEEGWFEASVNLQDAAFPVVYKYAVCHKENGEFIRFENEDNRYLNGYSGKLKVVVHDGFVRLNFRPFYGAGVAIPVFSLRTQNGLGVGEFEDLKLLADWSAECGLKLIQLLPINDTTATHTWKDSYPYSAISAFALHPLYLNLGKLAGNRHKKVLEGIEDKISEFNQLPAVDYERVLAQKWEHIKALFPKMKKSWLRGKSYKTFLEKHQYWLKPYAAFCYLREKFGSVQFSQWEDFAEFHPEKIQPFFTEDFEDYDEVAIHLFVQWHLHLQLTEAVEYAHSKGIIVKGDIPIGIYRYSCDAWQEPEFFRMEYQAGAPPDDFAVHGQNWGFPTYNWPKMAEDNFSWWKKRFSQMSLYFDAFRIDHILGFFRIWSIPIESVEGIMGYFVPAIPIHENEFRERQIWFDRDRFTKPFMPEQLIEEWFGARAPYVKRTFLEDNGWKYFRFKSEFDTQRKVENWFGVHPDAEEWIKQKLFDLHSNVLLLQNPDDYSDQYHFRIGMQETTSFQWLDEDLKGKLQSLYTDYFFRRQDSMWRHEAMTKLPELKAATNMMICGEDLGMVPDCVPGVMRDLGLLSLEIQRMPKDPRQMWFHPADAPYLSVVTPSTHDMSTLREWWEENPEASQRFYNEVLGFHGQAPFYCEPWIATAIIRQHIHSSGMWTIFQVQDLLGTNGEYRRESPQDERINIPADPNHYWRYRMHISLEKLLTFSQFNEGLRAELYSAGRTDRYSAET